MDKADNLVVATPTGEDTFLDASVAVMDGAVLQVTYHVAGEMVRRHYSPTGWLSYETTSGAPRVAIF